MPALPVSTTEPDTQPQKGRLRQSRHISRGLVIVLHGRFVFYLVKDKSTGRFHHDLLRVFEL